MPVAAALAVEVSLEEEFAGKATVAAAAATVAAGPASADEPEVAEMASFEQVFAAVADFDTRG